jgi:signal transduction histidine kinase
MTLKVRLMTMMMILVMGVLALQFILTEREKRELTSEIERLGTRVSSEARDVSLRAFVASRTGHPVREVLMAIEGDSLGDSTRATLRYVRTESFSTGGPVVLADSDRATAGRDESDRPGSGHGDQRIRDRRIEHERLVAGGEMPVDSLDMQLLVVPYPGGPDSIIDFTWRENVPEEVLARIDSAGGTFVTEIYIHDGDTLVSHRDLGPTARRRSARGSGAAPGETVPAEASTIEIHVPGPMSTAPWVGERDFALRLPIPVMERDSLHFVELAYPIAELTDRLAASRRRSIIWMTSLLGVGIVGAALMAAQFTRPIRTLERSFRRVEEGDLDVAVDPGRDDEIGRLTSSFNHMVGRLRESREMEERLRESERLATLGRLAAGVAHEVRNPLNAIKLTMQQLRDKTAPPEDAPGHADFERYYGTVTQELARLEGVVGAFLDLTRSESLSKEPMDLAETLRTSVELFAANAADRGVSLTIETSGPLPVHGDPARLTAVWNNLLSNALAATPAGGRITVRAIGEETEITVTIADTGAGIPPGELERIWEPFYSRRADGTGLGLGIVRSVVERHGGRVAAASTEGEGTMITVRLPLEGGHAGNAS